MPKQYGPIEGADLDAIEARLVSLAGVQKSGWQEIARLMIVVRDDELFKSHADNFTQWVRNIALKAGIHESNYWRYLKAGEFYLRITRNQGHLPALAQASIAAESLELLEKICRHAPEPAARDVVSRAMGGEIGRGELRALWHEYRPAQKENARGKGRGQSSHKFATDSDKASAASVIQILDSNRTWAFDQAFRLASFTEVAVRTGSARHARRIDYVLLYQSAPWDVEPVIVGVEVKVSKRDLEHDHKMSEYLPFVHAFFLAVPDTPELLVCAYDHISLDMGILAVNLQTLNVRVEQEARRRSEIQAPCTSETYRSLLLKKLSWNSESDDAP